MKKLFIFLAAVICAAGMTLTARADVLTFDFEGTNATIPAGWLNDPTYPWIVVNDGPAGFGGTYCIKSGNTTIASSSSTLQATFTFETSGSISFNASCWGEQGSRSVYDKCEFYIDGVLQFSLGVVLGWEPKPFEVSAGTHVFRWVYTKDSSVNSERDAFFVDNIVVVGGELILAPTVEDGWVYYDNGTEITSVRFGSSGSPFYWGIQIPAGTLSSTRNYLKKVSIYEDIAQEGDATVYIYQGGTTPLDADLLYSQQVFLTGYAAFQEITFETPVQIDPSQKTWIVFGTDVDDDFFLPASLSEVRNAPDARWMGRIEDGDLVWKDLATVISHRKDAAWMIRGFFDEAPHASNAQVSDITTTSAHLSWEGNEEEYDMGLYVWNLESEKYELLTIEKIEGKELTLTELSPGTTYLVAVVPHGGIDASGQVLVGNTQFTTITFATLDPCKVQPVVEVTELKATSAQISWTGMVENYKIGYVATDPTMPATILFIENNVWSDGTGYQMLIDADANTNDRLFTEDFTYFDGYETGDVPDEIYAEYEYKIPENADGSVATTNFIRGDRDFLDIPAGTYDWTITNPSPGQNSMIIIGSNGNAPRCADDWVFEGGMTYIFTPKLAGTGDGVFVEVSPTTGWFMTDDVTSPFTLTHLTPNTTYIVQVQNICNGNTEACSEILHFTTPEEDTGIEAVSGERLEVSGSRKILHEGNLYILRDGKIFNAQGARVK